MSPQNNNVDALISEFGLANNQSQTSSPVQAGTQNVPVENETGASGAPLTSPALSGQPKGMPQGALAPVPQQASQPQGALQQAQPQVKLSSPVIQKSQGLPPNQQLVTASNFPGKPTSDDDTDALINEYGLTPTDNTNYEESPSKKSNILPSLLDTAAISESAIPGMQLVAGGLKDAFEKYFPKGAQEIAQSSLIRADKGTLQSLVNDNIVNPLNLIPGVNIDPVAISDGSKAAIAGQILGHIGSYIAVGKFAKVLKAPQAIAKLAQVSEDIPVASSITKMLANPIGMRALGNGIYGAIQSPDNRLYSGALMALASPIVDLGAYGIGKGAQVVAAMGKGIKAAITGDTSQAILNYVKNKLLPGEELTPRDLNVAQQNVKTAQEVGISGIPAGALTQSPSIQAKEATLNVSTIKNAYDNVKNQLHSAIQDSIDQLGGQDTAKEILGQNINEVTQDSIDSARKNISNLYDNAAKAPGGNAYINSKSIVDAYDSLKGAFSSDNPFSKNIQTTIESLRPPKFGEVKIDGSQGLTVKGANDLIREINNQWPGNAPESASLRRSLGSLKNTVYSEIDKVATDSNNPSASLYQIARDARHALGDELQPTGKAPGQSLIKSISRGEVSPEKILGQVFKSTDNITELNNLERGLKFSIDENGNKVINPEGVKAWDNLRITKLSQMLNNSTDIVRDRNGNDIPILNYSKFLREYNKVGALAMAKIINNPSVFQTLKKLMEVAENVNKKQPGVINTSNTAHTMVQYGKNLISKIAQVKGAGVIMNLLKTVGHHFQDDDWVTRNLNLNEAFKKYPDLADQVKAIPGNLSDAQIMTHIINAAKGTLMGAFLQSQHLY